MDKAELLRLFKQMVVIRRLEEKSAELYPQGKIGGFLHLYIGQEATGVGAVSARRPAGPRHHRLPRPRPRHRCAAWSPRRSWPNCSARPPACSKGKGGSMHLADKNKRFWGGHAIVGGHLPLAAGLALAAKYREQDSCHALLLRRRRDQHRLLPRVAQPGRRVGSADRVRLREQPVRHGHRRRARLGRAGDGARRPPAYGIPSRPRGRHGRAGGARGHRSWPWSTPARATARSFWSRSPTASAATRWATRSATANRTK